MGVTKIVSRNEFSARTRGLIEEIMTMVDSGQQSAVGSPLRAEP
jgi:hypothetical protein